LATSTIDAARASIEPARVPVFLAVADRYDESMTAEFNARGFHFLYPENWKLVRDDQRGWPRSVSVHSPQGAFWSATLEREPANNLVERVAVLIQQEYEDVESEPIERTVGRHHLQGVELRFYCLDLIITAQVLESPEIAGRAVVLLQAEDRDFEQLARVFDAVTLSFLENLALTPDDN
jgi:hypothetical protein